MLSPERRALLLEQLRCNGSMKVTELMGVLGVTDVTVRRDINELVRAGLAQRFHGGVTLTEDGRHREAPAGASRQQRFGVLLPDNGYFREVLTGIAETTVGMNTRQALMLSQYDAASDLSAVRALVQDKADGLLLAPADAHNSGNAQFAEELRSLAVPVVLMERRLDATVLVDGLDHVVSDHETGARIAVEHLAGLGHKRIALIGKELGPTAPRVRTGYGYALRALGLDDLPAIEVPQLSSLENTGDRRFTDAVTTLEGLGATAVLIHGDHEAVALVQLARERGMRVPEDLAVVSYDDDMAAYASIPLTAVAPPKRQLGAIAVEVLAARIRHGSARPVQHIALQPSLVIRDSCGAARLRERRRTGLR